MAFLFMAGTLAGACLAYLAHPNQGWLAAPLPPRAGVAGACVLGGALACGLAAWSVTSAICAWLALAMLAFSLLPFGTLLRRPR